MAVQKKKCEHCGKKFHGIVTARFCSDVCRVYAWRKRKLVSVADSGE